MAEYSIEFAHEMSRVSNSVVLAGLESEATQRVVIYISLIACEIAMKSALEKAGKPVSEIKKDGHDLSKLLDNLSECTVLSEISIGVFRRVSASRIRSVVVDCNYADATVGKLLEAKNFGVSKFPNEIRYGDTLRYFPASVIACLSEKVVAWVKLHLDDLKA